VPYWQADDMAGLPAWTEAEIALFERRQARITWRGYGAPNLAETLLHRDRHHVSRGLCVECAHAGPGWRCAKREPFLLDQLQRCPGFDEPFTCAKRCGRWRGSGKRSAKYGEVGKKPGMPSPAAQSPAAAPGWSPIFGQQRRTEARVRAVQTKRRAMPVIPLAQSARGRLWRKLSRGDGACR